MTRRDEIAVLLPDAEMKIARRAGLAFKQMPVMKRPAAMLQAAFPLYFIGVNEFHGPVSRLGST